MFSFVQVPSTLTATSPHPITTCPSAGTWLKESQTIMKSESWSFFEPTGRRCLVPTGKSPLGSSSEIMLQNRSSDSLQSESLTWLPRRTRNHNPALSRPPSVPEHTTASQHQQPHPARNSLPKASWSVQCGLLPYTRWLMVLDDTVLPPILHPSRTAHCPGKSAGISARITEEISVIFRHFHDI